MGKLVEPDKNWPNFISGFEQNLDSFWHDLEIFIKLEQRQNWVGPLKVQNEFLHLLEHQSTVKEQAKINELKVYPQILQVRANKAFKKLCQLSFAMHTTPHVCSSYKKLMLIHHEKNNILFTVSGMFKGMIKSSLIFLPIN